LPVGRDFSAQVVPPGGGVVGVGVGVAVGDGDDVGVGVGEGGFVVGLGVGVPPPQAPRSDQSAGVAAGVQPAPAGGVWVTSAW
jgi:hypothetical protein